MICLAHQPAAPYVIASNNGNMDSPVQQKRALLMKASIQEASDESLDQALANLVAALKRENHPTSSETLEKELTRIMKRRKLSPEAQKAKVLFDTPPCRITAEEFAQVHGLIKICDKQRPCYDKFMDLEMNKRALKAVHVLVGITVGRSIRACGDPDGEQERQGIHELLLTTFRDFTTPRDPPKESDEEEATDTSSSEHEEDKPEEGIVDGPSSRYEEDDEGADFFISRIGVDDEEEESTDEDEPENSESIGTHSESTGTSTRSLLIDPQMQNEGEGAGRQHSDLMVKVFKTIGQEMRMVVDFKTKATCDNLFQPAMYAIGSLSLTSGLGNECRPPVCLQAWDKTTWYYGYIEIDGFIRVEEEEIVEDTLDTFPTNRAAAVAAAGPNSTPTFTRADIRKMFQKWKVDMKQKEMSILDGKYPVGKLYLDAEAHSMPKFVGKDVELTKSARRFYDGILKTLVGKKVINWTSKDVFEAYYRRKETVQLTRNVGLPKTDWKYVPGLASELAADNL